MLIPPRTPSLLPREPAIYAVFTCFDLISYIKLEFNRPRGNSHDRSSTMDLEKCYILPLLMHWGI